MGRSEQLFTLATQARRASRACARTAAAAALATIAGVIANVSGGIALALIACALLLARRIAWRTRARVQHDRALSAEMWESFERSNWRERTGWSRLAGAAALAIAFQVLSAGPASADGGNTTRALEARSYAALADAERVRLDLWGPRATTIADGVSALRPQGGTAAKEIDALERERATLVARIGVETDILALVRKRLDLLEERRAREAAAARVAPTNAVAAVARSIEDAARGIVAAITLARPNVTEPDLGTLIAQAKDDVDRHTLAIATDRAQLAAFVASIAARQHASATVQTDLDALALATERATALRRSSLALAERRDGAAAEVAQQADAAEREAVRLAAARGIALAPAFTLARPVLGEVSSPFGPRSSPGSAGGAEFHDGTDFAAPLGQPVVAAAAGVVVAAGRPYAPADTAVVVIVDHGNGLQSLYGHLTPKLAVRVGQRVEASTLLGFVGMTGRATGPHLHFGLTIHGRPIDAARFLDLS